ncbi:LOW QUALITY PROTEIN: uncharacterized protein [Amphiura filiformis]|uniref:LOW QUALITY PROTEIN: uncharacterized protein n=1 Tax=Amphiura filiformis TaxID=82378 RepID=UPI003B226892
MDMDASDHCKDPLHNLQTPSGENTHLPNGGHEETHHISIQDDNPPYQQLRFCSTSCMCMIIGVIITAGSIAMTACSYFADVLARETIIAGNVTEIILDEHLRTRITRYRTIGPVLIGLGSFFILCACVLICEARDRLMKPSEESEKILPKDYHDVDSYRTAASIKAESLAITPDIEFPLASSSSSESQYPVEDGHVCKIHGYDPSDLHERQGSPVVLVHGIKSIDDSFSRSSQELSIRTDSLKRPKDPDKSTNNNSSSDSSPTRVIHLQDSPIRKLPKLQLPPPSPPKTPRLLELSPSKLPVSNSVFPKPVLVKPIKLAPMHPTGNGPLARPSTSNQLLQTDFPSPDPSPVRVPRVHKKKVPEKYPTDTFLLKNLSPESVDLLSSCDSIETTGKDNKSFQYPGNDLLNREQGNPHESSNPADHEEGYMETSLDNMDNMNTPRDQQVTALCNVSAATDQQNQNGGHNGAGSLPDSDMSLRDTNSNVTGSTASVHSRNSHQSPSRARTVPNNKREVVLV